MSEQQQRNNRGKACRRSSNRGRSRLCRLRSSLADGEEEAVAKEEADQNDQRLLELDRR